LNYNFLVFPEERVSFDRGKMKGMRWVSTLIKCAIDWRLPARTGPPTIFIYRMKKTLTYHFLSGNIRAYTRLRAVQGTSW